MEPDLGLIIPRLYLTPIVVPPCERPAKKEQTQAAAVEASLDDATRAQKLMDKFNTTKKKK